MALSYFSHLYRGVSVQRQLLLRCQPLVYGNVRWYSDEGKKEMVTTPLGQQQQQNTGPQGSLGHRGLTDHKVRKLDKYILVWGGKYKSVADVPDLVRHDILERAKSKARIKINLMMCAATLLACLAMIYSGKKAHAAGESVVKINQDWHRKIKEEQKLSEEKPSQ